MRIDEMKLVDIKSNQIIDKRVVPREGGSEDRVEQRKQNWQLQSWVREEFPWQGFKAASQRNKIPTPKSSDSSLTLRPTPASSEAHGRNWVPSHLTVETTPKPFDTRIQELCLSYLGQASQRKL